jgi:hypothetical protein
VNAVARDADELARQVARVAAAREAHHGECAARTEQVAHARERRGLVHVMQRRARGDEVEPSSARSQRAGAASRSSG